MSLTADELEDLAQKLKLAFAHAATEVIKSIQSGDIPALFNEEHKLWYYRIPWDAEPLTTLRTIEWMNSFKGMFIDALQEASPRSLTLYETSKEGRMLSIFFKYGTKWNEWPEGIVPYGVK